MNGLGPSPLRADFPALVSGVGGKRLVYLDSACTALKPAAVIDAMSRAYAEAPACGGRRSSHLLSQASQDAADAARRAVARFLNAESANEIVFTQSTTDALDLLARAWRPPEGRTEVLVADLSHNSALLPFLERSKQGAFTLGLLASEGGRVAPETLEAALSERTGLVVLSAASNVLGGVQPLARLVRAARSRGSRVAVDAAQYVPTHRLDVQATDVDFAAFSAHKLGGPFGVGVLYGKEPLLNALGPARVGGGTLKELVPGGSLGWEPSYLDAPERFEAGVQNVPGWAGLAAALAYWESFGWDAVRARVSGLVDRAAKRLASAPGLRLLGEAERLAEGSLLSLAPEDPAFPLRDLNLYLNHELPGLVVAARAGEHCAHLLHRRQGLGPSLRLSFHAYNDAADVDLACGAIESFLKVLR